MSDITETLRERGSRYGEFPDHAIISKQLRGVIFQSMANNGNVQYLTPAMEESLILICHKLARICNGDPTYDDSWRDIAGYAQLIVDDLQPKD